MNGYSYERGAAMKESQEEFDMLKELELEFIHNL